MENQLQKPDSRTKEVENLNTEDLMTPIEQSQEINENCTKKSDKTTKPETEVPLVENSQEKGQTETPRGKNLNKQCLARQLREELGDGDYKPPRTLKLFH